MKCSMRRVSCACAITAALLLVACTARKPAEVQKPAALPQQESPRLTVQEGMRVGIEYTVALPDGSPVMTNVGKEPLVYRQGTRDLPQALQAALAGLHVGAHRHVTLTPAQAYGPVNPKAFREVDIDLVPSQARSVGSLLVGQDATGKQRRVRVHEVRENTVVLDFNHPLAGKTLRFDVRIVDIKQGEQS